jgi:hypothetical protein
MANAAGLSSLVPGYFTVDEATALPSDNKFVIVFAGQVTVGQGEKAEEKPALGFAATKKKLILNKGRCQQLAALFGDKDLEGETIRLSVESISGRPQIVVVAAE